MTAPGPKLYLLDVEGTTSPISLVHEQLFPYARKRLEPFLRQHFAESEIQADLALLAAENQAETCHALESGCPILAAPSRQEWESAISEASAYLLWLMDRDRKSTALKSLQGKIWKSGFEAGELVGKVFPDVPEALARWTNPPRNAKVAIYSSGSVEAQQLLFRHSSAGDLTPYISAYFDTRIGPKTAPGSYRAIAAAMGVESAEVLFISDVPRELDPARVAGCDTRLSLREGNQAVFEGGGHPVVRNFSQID